MQIKKSVVIFLLIVVSRVCNAQFLDEFNKDTLHKGWFFLPGDGTPTMDFVQKDGHATVVVDGSTDKYNCKLPLFLSHLKV